MKVGIIIGSTRPGRKGESVGKWVHENASQRSDAQFELIDLAAFELDLLNEATVPGAANKQYENEKTRRWSQVIDPLDGYVFVTGEYNHSVPAAFKNAFDVLGSEWSDKAVGLVGYGADGGVRSIEHWRQIGANLRLVAARNQVSLSLFTDWSNAGFTPGERRADELKGLLDQLIPLTAAMATLRS